MTNVSRSVFQKVVEENKKLKRQLRILCLDPGVESVLLRMKLRDEFKKEDGMNKAINSALKNVARQYFKDHPELTINNKTHE